jgi:hypothetical protein
MQEEGDAASLVLLSSDQPVERLRIVHGFLSR